MCRLSSSGDAGVRYGRLCCVAVLMVCAAWPFPSCSSADDVHLVLGSLCVAIKQRIRLSNSASYPKRGGIKSEIHKV